MLGRARPVQASSPPGRLGVESGFGEQVLVEVLGRSPRSDSHSVLIPSALESFASVTPTSNDTEVSVSVRFAPDSDVPQRLVKAGAACYSVSVHSPQTHFRELVTSASPAIEKIFSGGMLSEQVSFTPMFVSILPPYGHGSDLDEFLRSRDVDDKPGQVIAKGRELKVELEHVESSLICAVFGHRLDNAKNESDPSYEIREDRVWISMPEDIMQRLKSLWSEIGFCKEMLATIYLPILVEVLHDLDNRSGELRDHAWFKFIDRRLGEQRSMRLGTRGAQRLADAQRLLGCTIGDSLDVSSR